MSLNAVEQRAFRHFVIQVKELDRNDGHYFVDKQDKKQKIDLRQKNLNRNDSARPKIKVPHDRNRHHNSVAFFKSFNASALHLRQKPRSYRIQAIRLHKLLNGNIENDAAVFEPIVDRIAEKVHRFARSKAEKLAVGKAKR